MTTIATDGKSIAGDSLTTSNGIIVSSQAVKMFRAPDGRLGGATGEATQCNRFRRWFTDGGDKPELNDKFSALILNLDGTVDYYDDQHEPVRYDVPCAVGTGGEYAEGAMFAGKSPEEAVRIASIRDQGTGGTITVLTLTDPTNHNTQRGA